MSKERTGASASDEAGDAPKLSPEVEALLSEAADKAEVAQATIGQLTADLTAEREKGVGQSEALEKVTADLVAERAAHTASRDELSAAHAQIDRYKDELAETRDARRQTLSDLFSERAEDDDDLDLTEGVFVLTTSKVTDARDEQIPRGRLVTADAERAEKLLAAEHARPATAEDLRAATQPPVAL